MASTATTRNRFKKQGTGDNVNSWGTELNVGGLDRVDEAISGIAPYTLSGSKTLTSNNYTADEARMPVQHITGGTGGTVTIPGVQKQYLVINGATGSVTFTTGGGTTAVVAAGDAIWVSCDGTDVRAMKQTDYGASLITSSSAPTVNSHLANKGYVDSAIIQASLSASIPGQSGNAGKFLTTDGTNPSWATISQVAITDALGFTPTSVTTLTGTQSVSAFKAGLSLNNVDNTSDASKPISGATATALSAKAANGDVTASGLTMSTARVLGRTNALTGAIQELDASALRTFAGLVIGTDVQAYSAKLGTLSGQTWAADRFTYYTSSSAAAIGTITAAGRALIDDADAAAQRVTLGLSAANVQVVIDGSTQVITTGVKLDVVIPFACTITGWTLLADQSGSIVVDIFKDTYANYPPVIGDKITASAPPTISTATKAQSSTLTGWTTSIAAGDVLRINVNSATTITRVTLVLDVTR